MTAVFCVLITGSRDLTDPEPVYATLDDCLAFALSEGYTLLCVRHGHCPGGADKFADDWGRTMERNGYPVMVDAHPAQDHPTQDFGPWPGAGPRRNDYMVGLGAHECHAFVGPCTSPRCRRPGLHGSHGASGCADLAEKAGIDTHRVELWKES
jgi:hypothetical protein